MPDLPTLTVTAAQAQRCLAAWGSIAAYKTWLAASVRDYVRTSETAQRVEPYESAARAIRVEIASDDPLEGAT